MRERDSLMRGFADGAGLFLIAAAIVGWAIFAQAFQEPLIRDLPRADVMVLRP